MNAGKKGKLSVASSATKLEMTSGGELIDKGEVCLQLDSTSTPRNEFIYSYKKGQKIYRNVRDVCNLRAQSTTYLFVFASLSNE